MKLIGSTRASGLMAGKQKPGRGTGLAPVTVRSAKFLTNGTDEAFRRLINDLHAVEACLGRISAKLLVVVGLPPSQHHILRVVAELGTEEAVNVNRVAEILHMHSTQVTRELNELVRRKLVKKMPSPYDGRQTLLTVTEHGMNLLEEIAPSLQEINETMFGTFSKEDFANLCGLVKMLTDNIDKALIATDWVTTGVRRSAPSNSNQDNSGALWRTR